MAAAAARPPAWAVDLALAAVAYVLLELAWRAVRRRLPGAAGAGGPRRAAPAAPAPTLVVLGSGGHTAEMLLLLGGLDLERRYAPRVYAVAATDAGSAEKAAAFEARAGAPFAAVRVVPRAREVGQSYVSSVWSTLGALVASATVVWREEPGLLLCNGPGTCVPFAAAAKALNALAPWRRRCKVAYVESAARVTSLSLSGKLLFHLGLADLFLVQWPELADKLGPRAQCKGRLL